MEKKQVVCIVPSWENENWLWRLRDKIFGCKEADPQEGEIVTVEFEDDFYYHLEEYRDSGPYRKEGFVPLNNKFKEIELTKVLEEETKLVSSN